MAEFALGAVFTAALFWFLWSVVLKRRTHGSTSAPVSGALPPSVKQQADKGSNTKPIQSVKRTREKPSLPQIAKSSYTPIGDLERIVSSLEEKKQIILYGPPGTGKTFVALQLADYFTADGGDFNVVAFHPSYSYEDFVEGIRPRAVDGQIDYPVIGGTLKRMAQLSVENPNARFVLIIDEINRGNLGRILGELILLLEYRDTPLILPYSGDVFSLPPNLYLIGTMNSADRAIALVDFALRRRFTFFNFQPRSDVLAKFLSDFPPKMSASMVIMLFDGLNRKIAESKNLGKPFCIGHSYFMEKDLTEDKLERIWNHKIFPLLEEYYFDNPGDLEDFRGLVQEIVA
jgi:5-methylcytosine-specific restriction protein B